MNKPTATTDRFETPLRLRKRMGPHVNRVRAAARPYKLEIKRFSKFLVVGALGFVVDAGTFNLLISGLLGFELTPVVAGSISLVAAIISNFLWNHFWVYPDAHGNLILQFVQFFLVNYSIALVRLPLINFTHVPFTQFAHGALGFAESAADTVGANMALVLTVGIGLIWNFTVNRLWTYRHAPRH